MRVFISWSGERSRIVAQALKEWIPDVLQEAQTWMSQDIEAGRRWGSDIDAQLSATDFGVVCLTEENLRAPWILFEAGALAKRVEQDARLVPYLIDDMRPGNIEPPLGLFQSVRGDEQGTRQLINSINRALVTPLDNGRLACVFNDSWLRLRNDLQEVPASESVSRVERSQGEILLEVLDTVRNMSTSLDRIAPSSMPIASESDYHAYRTWLLKRRDSDLEMIKWADDMASLNDWAIPYEGVVYSEAPEGPDRQFEIEPTPLNWDAILKALRDQKKVLTATIFAESKIVELRGEVLRLTLPATPDFYVKEARNPRHLEAIKDIVEERTDVRPLLVIEARG